MSMAHQSASERVVKATIHVLVISLYVDSNVYSLAIMCVCKLLFCNIRCISSIAT
jgi:hypothetical protein